MQIDDLYCRLYIECDVDLPSIKDIIAGTVPCTRAGNYLNSPHASILVKENSDWNSNRFQAEESFVFSKLTAEIDPLDGLTIDTEGFIVHVCEVIKSLREFGAQVSAACDYEDKIYEQTGWNWRSDNRLHPTSEELKLKQSKP